MQLVFVSCIRPRFRAAHIPENASACDTRNRILAWKNIQEDDPGKTGTRTARGAGTGIVGWMILEIFRQGQGLSGG